jgi:uncharacterized OB-fold protein
VSGKGTLWSWTVLHAPPATPPYEPPTGEFEPFGVGDILLDEDVRIISRLSIANADWLTIGMRVEARVSPAVDTRPYALLEFEPATA